MTRCGETCTGGEIGVVAKNTRLMELHTTCLGLIHTELQ